MNCSVRTRTLIATSTIAKNIRSCFRVLTKIFHTKAQSFNEGTKRQRAISEFFVPLCENFVPLCETISCSLDCRNNHVPTDALSQSLEHRLRHNRRQKPQLSARQLFHFNFHVLEHSKQLTRLFAAVNFHERSRLVIAELNHPTHDLLRRPASQKLRAEQTAS